MTADNNFNVEPLTTLHRVTGTSPSGDQTGKRRQNRKGSPKPDEPDENIESNIGEQDSGDETFHVIDYRA